MARSATQTRTASATAKAKDAKRRMSASQVADVFGVHRVTVGQWIAKGCPVLESVGGTGEAYVLDVADVIKWYAKNAADEATERATAAFKKAQKSGLEGEGARDKEYWDAINAQARAGITIIEEAERRFAVAPIDLMDDISRARDDVLAQSLREVENRVEGDLPPDVKRGVIGPIVRKHINFALRSIASAKSFREEIGPMKPYEELPRTDGMEQYDA